MAKHTQTVLRDFQIRIRLLISRITPLTLSRRRKLKIEKKQKQKLTTQSLRNLLTIGLA